MSFQGHKGGNADPAISDLMLGFALMMVLEIALDQFSQPDEAVLPVTSPT